jgi:ATP phosphoribosyltransferase
VVSEYPNIAESFALGQRLRRFQIFPVWGAASVYLPENAELAIMSAASAKRLRNRGLVPVSTILEGGACLVANRASLERKDLSALLSALPDQPAGQSEGEEVLGPQAGKVMASPAERDAAVYVALPDGHQQPHTVNFLNRAGVEIDGYNVGEPSVRPRVGMSGVMAKVIRPQDMPQQVANGNFDLAITGRDWLLDHRYRFPSSPVEEILDLGFGRVRIVAVVAQDVPVSSTEDLRKLRRSSPLRVASEYVNIADKYAHDDRLTPYKVIPTWGASEAFLPEDADVLIENTETGSTIARNKLKIIDTLFESTACLIGNSEAVRSPQKEGRIRRLVDAVRAGVGDQRWHLGRKAVHAPDLSPPRNSGGDRSAAATPDPE